MSYRATSIEVTTAWDRGPYAVIPRLFLLSAEVLSLPPMALRVWLLLLSYAGAKTGAAWPRRDELAAALVTAPVTISRATSKLVVEGLLRKESLTATRIRYVLLVPPSVAGEWRS